MNLNDDPRRLWREHTKFGHFHPGLILDEDRIVLPAGDLLARRVWTRGGYHRLDFPGGQELARARLACAYMRPIPDACFDVLEQAARDWAQGEGALAYIRLAQARLGKFDDPETAAYRVFLADLFLHRPGRSPASLLKALGLDAPAKGVAKTYNPDEPRNPAGSGRVSGEWTSADDSGASASQPPSGAGTRGAMLATAGAAAGSFFSDEVSSEALAGLAEFAAGFLSPAIALGLLVIPYSNGSAVLQGSAPDGSGLTYRWARADNQLTISGGPNNDVLLAARLLPNGVFYDDDWNAIGRTTANGLVLDWNAISQIRSHSTAAQSLPTAQTGAGASEIDEDEEPRLCPAPTKDTPHGASAAAKEYQSKVTGLAVGLAVYLNGVFFDGCRPSNGVMVEAKGAYDQFIDADGNWYSWYADGPDSGVDRLEKQMIDESIAAGSRVVEYHVQGERGAEAFARMADNLKLPNIRVIHNPTGDYAY